MVYNTDEDHTARDLHLKYHLVWMPKYRHSVLVNDVADRVRSIIHEIADDKGVELLDLTIQPDHVHLFVSSHSKNEPALPANWFNSTSSRKYNHRYADHDGEKIEWARGYYAGTAGHVSSETVENDIQQHTVGES
jgi:putative transposase